MGDFTPISPPYKIYGADGSAWDVIGWINPSLLNFDPVVTDAEEGRARAWSIINGEDPWYPSPPA